MKTQMDVVLKHLQEKGSITTMECIKLYKDTRLSDKIYKLRRQMYLIPDEWKISPRGRRYKVYYYKGKRGDIDEKSCI